LYQFKKMNIMKKLTKAEEELMLILWKLKEALIRDIIAELENPETPYTTVSTIIRILEKKGFVSHKAYGNTHLYFPLVSKKEYSRTQLKDFVSNYFNGSFSSMATFFAKESNVSIDELRVMMAELEKEVQQKK
jgi:BlaI family transcriptional regulator, penicillinase repressor